MSTSHGKRKRAPSSVLYGGAHLFRRDTPKKLGDLARRSLDELDLGELLAIDPQAALGLRARVAEKLERQPIEDYRIDFEDGYGVRSPADEDAHADHVANELASAMEQATLPPRIGIRIKSLGKATRARALRTLHRVLDRLASAAHAVPDGFVVTLPKVRTAAEVTLLVDALDLREEDLGLSHGAIAIEVMVETADAILSKTGVCPLHEIVVAGRGRCVGAHFGAYDYLAELGVMAPAETALRHPACDHARRTMQVALASHREAVSLSDGATTILPVPRHRGAALTAQEHAENRAQVRAAAKLHAENVRRALADGLYQGWDLHPAQLPARYAAVFHWFDEQLPGARARLEGFRASQERAREVGGVFDDAATVAMLERFLREAP